jgi:hypothetical protein
MPATALTVQTDTRAGLNITALAVAADGTNGNSFVNDGMTTLEVLNGTATACVVTLTFGAGATVDGQSPTNRTVSVTGNKHFRIGPFPTNLYGTTVTVTYDQVNTVTVAVVKTVPAG